MFTDIINMLQFNIDNKKDFLNSAEPEIQILTGWFEKTNRLEKIKRKYKYNG